MKSKLEIINDYFTAYNNFEVNKMIEDFDVNILFENVSEGVVNLQTEGIIPFTAQAKKASLILSERHAKILSTRELNKHQIQVKLHYSAKVGKAFNGIPAGEVIEVEGKSVFTFKNNKVVKLQDIS